LIEIITRKYLRGSEEGRGEKKSSVKETGVSPRFAIGTP
jgi:hypothetical protein